MNPSEIIKAKIRTVETVVRKNTTVYPNGAFSLSFRNEAGVGKAVVTLWDFTTLDPGDPLFILSGIVTGAGPGQVLVTERTDVIPVVFGAGTRELIIYKTFIDNIDICKPEDY